MKYVVLKTHAKTSGIGLYKQGEILDGKEIEDLQHKIKPKVGSGDQILGPPLVKEFRGKVKEEKVKVKTKEEKVTKTTKTAGK